MSQEQARQVNYFPINEVVPPMEFICVWRGAFTPEECENIIAFGEMHEFQRAAVGDRGTGDVNNEVRNSDINWIHPSHESDWIFRRLADVGAQVNHDKFGLELKGMDAMQFTQYKLDQHYDWHIDTMKQPNNRFMHRKLSAVVLLTPPEEYEGGELLLSPDGRPEKAIEMRPLAGDIVFFYSFVPHKVAPVTSGKRISLVSWMLGPKFK